MADTFSTIFKLRKPQIATTGWGPKLNLDIDHLDAVLASGAYVSPVQTAGVLSIDASAGQFQRAVITGTTMISFTNWVSNYTESGATPPQLAQRVMLLLQQTNPGDTDAVTWTGVTWLTGTAPVIDPTADTLLEFVSWDNGATILGWVLPGTLSITSGMIQGGANLIGSVTPASTTGGTEVELGSVTVPGGTLANNGDSIKIYAAARQTNTAPGSPFGTLRVRFGSTAYVGSVTETIASTGRPSIIEVVITRLSATTQRTTTRTVNGSAPSAVLAAETSAPGETLSGAVVVSFRGKQSVADAAFPWQIDQGIVTRS